MGRSLLLLAAILASSIALAQPRPATPAPEAPPMSSTPIDEVMANQPDLVDAVHGLKQVLCVKGREMPS